MKPFERFSRNSALYIQFFEKYARFTAKVIKYYRQGFLLSRKNLWEVDTFTSPSCTHVQHLAANLATSVCYTFSQWAISKRDQRKGNFILLKEEMNF